MVRRILAYPVTRFRSSGVFEAPCLEPDRAHRREAASLWTVSAVRHPGYPPPNYIWTEIHAKARECGIRKAADIINLNYEPNQDLPCHRSASFQESRPISLGPKRKFLPAVGFGIDSRTCASTHEAGHFVTSHEQIK